MGTVTRASLGEGPAREVHTPHHSNYVTLRKGRDMGTVVRAVAAESWGGGAGGGRAGQRDTRVGRQRRARAATRVSKATGHATQTIEPRANCELELPITRRYRSTDHTLIGHQRRRWGGAVEGPRGNSAGCTFFFMKPKLLQNNKAY